MKLTRRAALLGVAACMAPLARAQSYPNRAVKVIYNFAAGGTGDALARYVAQQMGAILGQQYVVENRTGAGGAVGILAGARAPADGYTLLITTITTVAQTPYLTRDASFDPVRAMTAIGNMAASPMMLLAHPSVPAHDFPSFLEWARKQPDGVNIGSAGPTLEMVMAYLSRELKVKLVNVSYRGQAPALLAALAGEVQMFAGTASSTTAEFIKLGKLKVIGVTTAQPTPVVPGGVPIARFVPGFVQDINFAMWTPAGTPGDVRARLTDALMRVMAEPGMDERLLGYGLAKAVGGPQDVVRITERERDYIRKVLETTPVKFGE